ncbi:type II secretion system inner membrane protein GspF [bacterium]|nr:type II secretion system inner membrane protein GspF [bacterium]
MSTFAYKALDKAGTEVAGTLDADNDRLALGRLRDMGYLPLEVREEKIAKGGIVDTFLGIFTGKRVKGKDIVTFTRQLSTLIDSGLPLLRSLNVLGEQTENPNLKVQIKDIASSVQGGSTFSDALAKHPRTFNKLYVNMVKAGEAGGVLEVVLARLAEFSEKDQAVRAKVKGAMVYPALVIMVGVGVVLFLTIAIIPTFVSMFVEVNLTLPLPTRIMMGASDFLRSFWWVNLLAILALVMIYKMWVRKEKGKYQADRIKLKIPILGELARKSALSRFARTLGTLITSGVPILQALLIVRDTAGNEVIARAMVAVHNSIREGESIAGPLGKSPVFPPMVVHMIAVGEETGALDNMLIKVSDTYDREVDTTVAALTSVLEPILILGMGVVVGFIVIAMYLPIFQMSAMTG